MKLKNVLFGSAVAVALMFGFASCKDEDENDALEGYSISLTNDGTLTDSAGKTIEYARQWNVTHTNHLSADATITIDRTTKSTQVGKTKNSTNGSVTTTDGGNNAAYIFGLKGSGTADEPYSFYLMGFRLNGAQPQYFISYYTGVQSDYLNSDANDFDTDDVTNTAYEYIYKSWGNLDSSAYTLTEDKFSVYIDMAAIYGTDNTEVTADNYATAVKAGIDGYKITLKSSATATGGTEKVLHYTDFTAQTYSNSKTAAPALSTFSVTQARLGFYAMVGSGKTLVANLEFNNDTIVKSAAGGSTDDFGKAIDLDGESCKNF